MTAIQVLPEKVINHIAAGEVIEDPSSVIKELVDNAIDADASQITIRVTSGGFSSLSVEDNGIGIASKEALLVFERHATSKLRTSQELFQILTMGFRGEAISSIASVSKVHLTSFNGIGDKGFRMVCEGGRLITQTPAPPRQGTKVEVLQLFYNTPARKAFQKSPVASLRQVIRMVTRLALAHPAIRMVLQNSEHVVLDSGHQSCLGTVIENVLGKEVMHSMRPVSYKGEVVIDGYVKEPAMMHANRLGQYLSVNKRPVVSAEIESAIREGYGYFTESIKHPSFVLNFTMNPDVVDVNVHPQKKIIRFVNPILLQSTVKKALFTALETTDNHTQPISPSGPIDPATWSFTAPQPSPSSEFTPPDVWDFSNTQPIKEEPTFIPLHIRVLGLYKHYFFFENLEEGCFGTHGLIFFDMNRAQNALAHLTLSKNQKIAPQALLFSKLLPLSAEEALFLEHTMESFLQYGLDVSLVDKQQVSVSGAPSFVSEEEIEHYFSKVIHALMENKSVPFASIYRYGRKSYCIEEAKEVVKLVKQKQLPQVYEGKKIWANGDDVLIKQWMKNS